MQAPHSVDASATSAASGWSPASSGVSTDPIGPGYTQP